MIESVKIFFGKFNFVDLLKILWWKFFFGIGEVFVECFYKFLIEFYVNFWLWFVCFK